MKSLLFTLLLLGGLAGSASAQKQEQFVELPGFSGPSPLLVEELTRQMSSALHLDEAQYIHLRSANEAKLTRLDEISWQYPGEAEQRAKVRELQVQYEAECSHILTPAQLSLFQQSNPVTPESGIPLNQVNLAKRQSNRNTGRRRPPITEGRLLPVQGGSIQADARGIRSRALSFRRQALQVLK